MVENGDYFYVPCYKSFIKIVGQRGKGNKTYYRTSALFANSQEVLFVEKYLNFLLSTINNPKICKPIKRNDVRLLKRKEKLACALRQELEQVEKF
jgi:hypothetical protein